MKKKIKIEFEVSDLSEKGKEFVNDDCIRKQLKEVYDEYIKAEGCSEVKITISTIS